MLMLICQSGALFVPVEDILKELVRCEVWLHRWRIIDRLGGLDDGTEEFADALLDQLFLAQRPFSRELLGGVRAPFDGGLNFLGDRPIAGGYVLLVDVGIEQDFRVGDGGEAVAFQAWRLEDIGPALVVLVGTGLPDFGIGADGTLAEPAALVASMANWSLR